MRRCGIACGILLASLAAGGALAAEAGAGKQTLVLPIPLPASGTNAPELKCAISFGPPAPIAALAFSTDGQKLYAGGYREVLVWDVVEGKLARRIGAAQMSGQVRALAVTKDGRTLIVGEGSAGESGAVRLFDVSSGKLLASLTEAKDVVQCLALSPDGALLAAGASDGNVYIWNIADHTLAKTLSGQAAGVCFSPDGKMLAAGGSDRQLRVWEVEEWKEHSSIATPEAITDLAFLKDGELLAAAVAGPSEWAIRVQRVASPNARDTRALPCGGAAVLRMAAAAGAGGRPGRALVACADNTVKALTPGTSSQPLFVMRGHAAPVCALAVSPEGDRIASGSLDGTVRLWSVLGRPLGTMVQLAPGTDEWAISTPAGFFASSTPAAVRWRTKNVTFSPAELSAKFGDPTAVRRILAGQSLPNPLISPPAKTPGEDWRARQQRWQRWRNMQGAEGKQ